MKKIGKYFAIAIASLAIVSTVNAQSGPVVPPAAKTLDIRSGSTSLTVSDDFEAATAAITIKKLNPGKVSITGPRSNKTISVKFAVNGGAVDTSNAFGEITHGGGFILSGKTEIEVAGEPQEVKVNVSVTDLVINIAEDAASGTGSALVTVNGVLAGRVELFSLDFSEAGVVTPLVVKKNKPVKLSGVAVNLTQAGADKLNEAFNAPIDTPIFDTATSVGTAKITLIVENKSL